MLIDLRSDTLTQPTPALREAMLQAPVGDDVYGEDPSMNELEARVAEVLGKEDAVFMPSGTMTNQVALRTHTEPGDEILLEAQAHIYYYEAGGPAALSGVMCRLIHGEGGLFGAEELRHALRKPDQHFPQTKLVCVENTHNRGGGRIIPLETIQAIAEVCREQELRLHLDGARLWNACIATGIPAEDYVRDFDSVSVCFSKGLGAPVGSALAGSRAFVKRARRFRKMFGGGMRQAGLLAAGALFAMEQQWERLQEDHDNAQTLAQGLARVEGLELNPADVQTNIVLFQTPTLPAPELVRRLQQKGVGMLVFGEHSVRAVTSLQVTAAQVAQVPKLVEEALRDHEE